MATSCTELTHWKRLWFWKGLGAGRKGDDRGWDGWLASPTRWMWVWMTSGSWWWAGRPGVKQFMGLQRVRHDWATELNWTELISLKPCYHIAGGCSFRLCCESNITPFFLLLCSDSHCILSDSCYYLRVNMKIPLHVLLWSIQSWKNMPRKCNVRSQALDTAKLLYNIYTINSHVHEISFCYILTRFKYYMTLIFLSFWRTQSVL